jgi:hypothetical protein
MPPASTTLKVPTTLYRLFSADDALLYVGVTGNVKTRMAYHSTDKPWWPEVARMEVESHPSRTAAETAEDHAIAGERPRYNIAGVDPAGRYRRPNAPVDWPEWDDDILMDMFGKISALMADPAVGHADARLRSLNILLTGRDELPGGTELARLASQCGVSRSEAYNARRRVPVA